jgi:hypothetical protein
MATVTWNVNKDARIATSGGTSLGAGASDFNPVGYYYSNGWYTYRTLLGFSYSFAGMVSITSAILWMKSSTQNYVAFGTSPSLRAARLSSSWSEGTSVSMSGSNAVEWSNQPGITGSVSAASAMTETELTWDTIDITTIIQEAFAANSFYGLRIYANSETDATDVWEMCSREYSTSSDPYIVVTYTTNTAPTAPTNLSPTGSAVLNTLTPTFTATFNDPDAGEVMANYQINVYEDNGTTLKWDSGTIAGSSISKVYNGPALTGNTYYQWTVRAQDDGGLWGPYQPTLSRFKVNSVPNAPTLSMVESPTTDIKTLTPTFSITHSDPDASDSLMSAYRLYVWNSAWGGLWDTGYVAVTPTATKQVTYAGPALSWNSTYYWSAYTYDSNGATYGNWGSYPSFTTHKTGTAIGLDPTANEVVSLDGSGNPMPTFVGSRASTADLLTNAYIKVFAAADLVNPVWTSSSATGVTSTGFSRAYGGTTLSYGTSYAWQVQVTSSIGGVSDWSALQYFTTPAAGSISMTAPVSPVTDTTPDFTFGRATNFNAWNIVVYDSTGTSVMWDSGTQTMTAGTTKTATYAVGGTVNLATLAWNTTYKWKVRVSADSGSTWGSGFTGLVAFTMDSAGVPTLNYPQSDSWLGAPEVVDAYDNTTSVTNGTSAATSIDTAAADKQTGRGSLKIALTTLSAGTTSETYRTVTKNLLKYGAQTPFKIWVRASTLTNLSNIRVRFTFATTGDYAEYAITPASTSWEQKTVTKGSPTATAGTVNWANITRIGIRVTSVTGAYTGNVNVDDLKVDATAPSFDGTTYNSEVISTYRIRVYPTSDGSGAATWDSGDIAGSGTTFSKLYTGTTLSKGTTYYWQARYIKSTGPTGNYSALYPFVLNSDPSIPAAMVPQSGEVVENNLTPTFYSTFSDNEKATRGDTPSAYEVEVSRNSDSVLVYTLFKDSGLSAGTNSVTDGDAGILKVTGAANPIAYETEYKYRVRYYDSMGAVGQWSSYLVFKPSQSPTTTIGVPAHSGTITSPAVNVTWSMSSPGSKSQNSFQLKVVRVDTASTVFDTGRSYSSVQTYALPGGYLVNSKQYDFMVMTWDTDGLASTWDTNTVTTNWTAPDPIVDFTAADNVEVSAVVCEWTVSNTAGAYFRKYTIYRKESTEYNWSLLVEIPNQSTVQYYDYLTANNVSYDYKITQWSIVTGDADLESGDSDWSTVTLDTDSWFVVGADKNISHIFELPVSAAPFVEPVQQEVFEPLGTSRKVIVRGKTLGAEGSMQCKWRDSERESAKDQIDYIKSNAGPHILKSPFGDIWLVEFSGPSKDYLGGGNMTATLVWTEVQ